MILDWLGSCSLRNILKQKLLLICQRAALTQSWKMWRGWLGKSIHPPASAAQNILEFYIFTSAYGCRRAEPWSREASLNSLHMSLWLWDYVSNPWFAVTALMSVASLERGWFQMLCTFQMNEKVHQKSCIPNEWKTASEQSGKNLACTCSLLPLVKISLECDYGVYICLNVFITPIRPS